MLQTLNPYLNTDKTAEIMARYRPIAPKPADVLLNSEKINQSPYLRNVWPHLQARPTRTRKRGRTSVGPPSTKRSRSFLSPPPDEPANKGYGFTHHQHAKLTPVTTQATLVTLPLLPCPTDFNGGEEKIIDLNKVPQENDFLRLFQGSTNVIAPQPVRPVGSSISIRSIRENPDPTPEMQLVKKAEEEIESERSPVVVTDSNNKVRLVNSAYKEMVGEPECLWLDSMVSCDGGVACSSSSKRICGEVTLQLPDSGLPVCSSNGFCCWARIEWRRDGKKRSVDTAWIVELLWWSFPLEIVGIYFDLQIKIKLNEEQVNIPKTKGNIRSKYYLNMKK